MFREVLRDELGVQREGQEVGDWDGRELWDVGFYYNGTW